MGSAPDLRAVPHGAGLRVLFAIAACLIAAVASQLRGGKYHHTEDATVPAAAATGVEPVEEVTAGAQPKGVVGRRPQMTTNPTRSAL
jgi:hypothetical protein